MDPNATRRESQVEAMSNRQPRYGVVYYTAADGEPTVDSIWDHQVSGLKGFIPIDDVKRALVAALLELFT